MLTLPVLRIDVSADLISLIFGAAEDGRKSDFSAADGDSLSESWNSPEYVATRFVSDRSSDSYWDSRMERRLRGTLDMNDVSFGL